MNKELLEIVLNLKDNFSKGITKMKNKSVSGLAKIRMGFQSMGAAIKKNLFNVKALISAFLALSALRGFFRFMKEAIRLSSEQNVAISNLNAALRSHGNFTEEASKSLQDYASNLQESLGIADEVTIATIAMTESLTGLSVDAIPGAMDAVIQISSLYKVDFKVASILLAKTLTSSMNAFARYGIEVDSSATAQEKLDQIIKGTAAGMAIAEARLETFDGQTMRLGNSWGDLLEGFGSYITRNPIVIASLDLMGTWINRLTGAVNEGQEASIDLVGKGFGAMIDGAINVVKSIIGMVKIFTLARQGMQTLLSAILQFALAFLEVMEDILSGFLDWLFGVINKATEGINGFLDWLENKFGFVILRIAPISITGSEAMAAAIAGVNQAIIDLDENTEDLTDDLLEMDDIVTALTVAQMELADVIANASRESADASNNFNNFTEDLDDVADAAGGVKDAISDMNDEFERANRIVEASTHPIIQALIDRLTSFLGIVRQLEDIEIQAQLDEIRAAEIRVLSERFFGPGASAFDILFDLVDSQEQVEKTFSNLELSIIASVERLSESILSGDISAAFSRTFDQVGSAIANKVNESISKQFQTEEGGGTLLGGILGAFGGGLVGAGVGLLGGLLGRKKKQGQTRADALKVEVVNTGNIGDAILSALTKAQLIGAGAAGINNITADLRMQGARINSS